jgi:hypothetical protein
MTTESKPKARRSRLRGKVGRPKNVPDAPKDGPLAPERVYGSTGLGIPEERAQRILCAVEAGIALTTICREFAVSHHTVHALVRNRPDLMAKANTIIKGNWAYIAMMTSAELAARLADMKDGALTMLAGIAADKNLLLGGQPTQRVEHTIAPAADAWASFVEDVRSRQEAVDVAWEPVEVAGNTAQKDIAALPPVNSVPQPEIIDADVQRLTL